MDERGFGMPITIKTAIDNIDANKYLIPAIQRKFVWTHEKIENLFDSIMRDYPINSFMFWQITDENIKNTFKFYKFITHYRQRYHEDTRKQIEEYLRELKWSKDQINFFIEIIIEYLACAGFDVDFDDPIDVIWTFNYTKFRN